MELRKKKKRADATDETRFQEQKKNAEKLTVISKPKLHEHRGSTMESFSCIRVYVSNYTERKYESFSCDDFAVDCIASNEQK